MYDIVASLQRQAPSRLSNFHVEPPAWGKFITTPVDCEVCKLEIERAEILNWHLEVGDEIKNLNWMVKMGEFEAICQCTLLESFFIRDGEAVHFVRCRGPLQLCAEDVCLCCFGNGAWNVPVCNEAVFCARIDPM